MTIHPRLFFYSAIAVIVALLVIARWRLVAHNLAAIVLMLLAWLCDGVHRATIWSWSARWSWRLRRTVDDLAEWARR